VDGSFWIIASTSPEGQLLGWMASSFPLPPPCCETDDCEYMGWSLPRCATNCRAAQDAAGCRQHSGCCNSNSSRRRRRLSCQQRLCPALRRERAANIVRRSRVLLRWQYPTRTSESLPTTIASISGWLLLHMRYLSAWARTVNPPQCSTTVWVATAADGEHGPGKIYGDIGGSKRAYHQMTC
jgi:hypothetical protein